MEGCWHPLSLPSSSLTLSLPFSPLSFPLCVSLSFFSSPPPLSLSLSSSISFSFSFFIHLSLLCLSSFLSFFFSLSLSPLVISFLLPPHYFVLSLGNSTPVQCLTPLVHHLPVDVTKPLFRNILCFFLVFKTFPVKLQQEDQQQCLCNNDLLLCPLVWKKWKKTDDNKAVGYFMEKKLCRQGYLLVMRKYHT